jgi:hypothetical protein
MALPNVVRASVTKLVPDARFVFTGKVERQGSSLSLLPSASTTAVVRVERIHHAPAGLRDQTGQPVTVVFVGDAPMAGDDRRRIFFTNPIFYGETVGVKEIGHIDAPGDLDELHELVVRVTEEARVEELRRHLESAEAVVHGKVVSVRRASEASVVPLSEHDPIWWLATIRVTRSLKGDLRREVAVRYPKSRDVRWYGVPKPTEGQEAIFILHRDGLDVGHAVLAIVDSQDVRPASKGELRRIADLI